MYIVTKQNSQERVKLVIDATLNTLQTHYEILLQTQKITALTLYQSTIESPRLLEILAQAQKANTEEKSILRKELKNMLTPRYKRSKLKGVLQYQFIFPDNTAFLRMHKPSKFGDDLTEIREDFRFVNKYKKPIRVFTQGRTAHGFRNSFPIFDKNGSHIGAMEISFSSNSFQWFLNHISHIHTHFLVDKDIFDVKTWKRDDLIFQYSQSAENADYMLSLGMIHSKEKCITENIIKFKNIREELDDKMKKGNKFGLFSQYKDHVAVFSFLPIKNLKSQTIAWLVSYDKSDFIELTLKNVLVMRIVVFLFTTLLVYFIALQIRSKELIDKLLKETQEKVYIDTLTKVYNRNKFDEVFEKEIHRVRRYNYQLSMAIIDIDKFKDFNDTYGHLIGDEVLIVMAQTIKKSIRSTDIFARWGGEEFVILFTHTAIEDAKVISYKLKDKVQSIEHPVAGNITISCGLTEYREHDTIDSIFQRCDEALYKAKINGRNRVECL